MTDVIWDPEDAKPEAAAALDESIRAVAPTGIVKLTRRGDVWFVRALGPAALCSRRADHAARDLSGKIAEILEDCGYRARS